MPNVVKNRSQVPESYRPKKPTILSMAEKANVKENFANTYTVKTENGTTYIDGFPQLQWGKWKDCSYCGCVTAILNVIGINISYEEVMGLSGACYKAIMLDNWCPSSEMLQNGINCEENVGKAVGVAVYTIQDEEQRNQQVINSIHAGVPVLICGQRWEPEWSVVCGYKFENNKIKFFGRTYFDYHTDVPKDEIYTDNKYFCADRYPGMFPEALLRFYDKSCEPISKKSALKVSLETCIKMFEQVSGNHKFGYDAYDTLIRGFELDDQAYYMNCSNDQYHIGSLMDARRAASVYFETNADILSGANKDKLLIASQLYKNMLDELLSAVPYVIEENLSSFNGSADPAWDIQTRKNIASALRKMKVMEKEVRVIVKDILDHWED